MSFFLFYFFSFSTYRNCSFPMECLKNSLQILCIYAELLNSAVLLFIFYFIFWCFWCIRWQSQTVTTSSRRPPSPQGSALLHASPRPGAGCPHLSMHCLIGEGLGVLSQFPGTAPTRPHPRKPQMHQTGTLFPARALSGRLMPPGCPGWGWGVGESRGAVPVHCCTLW